MPRLLGIINCPTLRSDGSILDRPGYDPQTFLLYDPEGVVFSPVSANPTKADARAALDTLRELIGTFPFVADTDRSVALSAILTAMVRRSIDTAPLHGFSAPTAGSGKSKLVDIASVIVTGRRAAVLSQGKTEEEMEKRLGSALIAGDPIISLDNCDEPVGGELICQMLTQTSVKVRILGKSTLVEAPSNAMIFATGNNLTVVGDMTRRTVICHLDPKVERPELREFTNDPVADALAGRDRYVNAALTILRAFHVAGRPRQASPLGSFEGWSNWVRGALIWLGEADPCDSIEKIRAADPKLDAITHVFSQWYAVFGCERVTVEKAIERAMGQSPSFDDEPKSGLREALLIVAGVAGTINSVRLGKWLGGNKNRVVNGMKVVQDGSNGGARVWRMQVADSA